jgi:Leucine-rich repeat (LRR) protein
MIIIKLNQNERGLYNSIKSLLLTNDYSKIDNGLNLLYNSGNPNYYEMLLTDCTIRNGILIASETFTMSTPRQPFVDYALWNIIGFAPGHIKIHHTLRKRSIKYLKLVEYESHLHCFHRIEKFPLGITKLINLTKVDFSETRIDKLPSEIAELTNLKELILTNNKLSSINKELFKLNKIEHLNLQNNQITDMPTEVGKLKNLKVFNLKNNNLSSLPQSIKDLENLEEINLSQNNFIDFPEVLSNLSCLKVIDISDNKITNVPFGINTLWNLNRLNLSKNLIKEFPKIKLEQLADLDLSENKIKLINSYIRELPNLMKLSVVGNRELSLIEPGIVSLGRLENLHFGRCGNIIPKPNVLYLNGVANVDSYLQKVCKYYKLPIIKSRILKNIKKTNYIKKRSYYHSFELEKPAKKIADIIHNLDKYLESYDLDFINAGINLINGISNNSVYKYLLGKWLIKHGRLNHNSNYRGYDNYEYKFSNYIISRLITEASSDIILPHNLHPDNVYEVYHNVDIIGFPEYLFKFKNLTKIAIDFEDQNFKTDLYRLDNLRVIEIEKLKDLGNVDFHKFKLLEEIKIEDSEVKGDFKIDDWEKLRKVDFKKLEADSIIISNNCELEEINLERTKVKKLIIKNCQNIKSITIKSCIIIEEIEYDILESLITFNLQDTTVIFDTTKLFKSLNLEELIIKHSGKIVLDGSIGRLLNLKRITLAGNDIDYLPSEIGNLSNLEYLNVEKNNLCELPDTLVQCRKLKVINLNNQGGNTKDKNILREIPFELFYLPKISHISISWNLLKLRKLKSKLSTNNLYSKLNIITNY